MNESSLILCPSVSLKSIGKTSDEYLKECGLSIRRELLGENDCGMIAWRIDMKTPECPMGRRIIVISNDITYKIGSFGIEEDLLFQRASEYARLERIPRIFLSANSGARIGLAEELKSLYHIAWNDPNDIEKGIKYLYLTQDDYSQISHFNCVRTEIVHEYGQIRYKIIDIIGKENGLGVENLRGSGMIAGETSLAYNLIVIIIQSFFLLFSCLGGGGFVPKFVRKDPLQGIYYKLTGVIFVQRLFYMPRYCWWGPAQRK